MKNMKKSLLAMAALAACCSFAQAEDSVSIFGNIDAGVMSQSTSAKGGSRTGFVDGQLTPSLFGLKGSRSLDDGLKASFLLEEGFNIGNGTPNSPGVSNNLLNGNNQLNKTGQSVFSREAKVTLGGDWGTLGAGLQVDPALAASISTEPRGLTNTFSMLQYWVVATANNVLANNSNPNLVSGGIFDSNSVSYTYTGTPGLYVGLLHGFNDTGSLAGDSNITNSLGISYKTNGFTFSGSLAGAANPVASAFATKITDFGLAYAMDSMTVRFQAGDFKSAGVLTGMALSDVASYGLGLDYKSSAKNTFNVSYYNAKDKGLGATGSTNTLALKDEYSLGKGFSIYVQYANVNEGKNAGLSNAYGGALGVYQPAGSAAAVNTNYFGTGLHMSF
jgi:predicted porin